MLVVLHLVFQKSIRRKTSNRHWKKLSKKMMKLSSKVSSKEPRFLLESTDMKERLLSWALLKSFLSVTSLTELPNMKDKLKRLPQPDLILKHIRKWKRSQNTHTILWKWTQFQEVNSSLWMGFLTCWKWTPTQDLPQQAFCLNR